MTVVALDSSAVVTWLLQEQKWKVVQAVLSAASEAVLLGPALTEVIVVARKKGNTSSPAQLYLALQAVGMKVLLPDDDDFVRAAQLQEVSAHHPGAESSGGRRATLSLGDSIIIAMAERRRQPLLTGDRYWKTFADAGHTTAAVNSLYG